MYIILGWRGGLAIVARKISKLSQHMYRYINDPKIARSYHMYTYIKDPKVARRTCNCGSQNVMGCLKQTYLIVVKYVYFNK